MSDTTSNKTPGRPKKNVQWPETPFTVQSLHLTTGLSKVTLYMKFKEAEDDGIIERVGNENAKQGRPKILFQIKKKQEVPAAVAA
jgi:predicted transcriptional regulator